MKATGPVLIVAIFAILIVKLERLVVGETCKFIPYAQAYIKFL